MNSFLTLHGTAVAGTISTFDRIILKGHFTSMFPDGAFQRYLSKRGVLLKDSGQFFESQTKQIKQHAEEVAKQNHRPFIYLDSPHTHASKKSKEELARAIAEKDNITEGLVCIFSVLEPCISFQVRGNWKTQRLEVVRRKRKCLHLYYYLLDCALRLDARSHPNMGALLDANIYQWPRVVVSTTSGQRHCPRKK